MGKQPARTASKEKRSEIRSSEKRSKEIRREEQRQRAIEEQQRIARRKRLTLASVGAGAILVIALFIYALHLISLSNQTTAAAPVNPSYPAVDGISCDASEQLAYHIHVHLSMYIDGQPVSLPAQIGIAPDGSCYYWLHTHDTTGVIHIESPTQHIYTLGNFFDIWNTYFQQLGFPTQLSDQNGWTVYVNGQPYKGDFRQIPLNAHTLITMGYNSPGIKPDITYNWGDL